MISDIIKPDEQVYVLTKEQLLEFVAVLTVINRFYPEMGFEEAIEKAFDPDFIKDLLKKLDEEIANENEEHGVS